VIPGNWLARSFSDQPDLFVVPVRPITEELIVRPDTLVRLRDFALDIEHVEQSLTFIGWRIPVQERPAAETIGQNDRQIVQWWPTTYSFRGLSPLVDEVSPNGPDGAFGTAAASRVASK
jgi:hypothetical protein